MLKLFQHIAELKHQELSLHPCFSITLLIQLVEEPLPHATKLNLLICPTKATSQLTSPILEVKSVYEAIMCLADTGAIPIPLQKHLMAINGL